jgi:DNA replication protein DnaC
MVKAKTGLEKIFKKIKSLQDLLPVDKDFTPEIRMDIKSVDKIRLFGTRFINATFNSYILTNDKQRKAFMYAQKIAEKLKEMPKNAGIIAAFVGMSGTGKDHLAASIFDYVYSPGLKVIHTSVMKMSRVIRGADKQQQIIDEYTDVDLLIINEVGVQKVSDFERQFLYEVINDLYRNMKSCLLISNEEEDDFRACLDFAEKSRVWDRLGGRVIVFDWESYRPLENRKANETTNIK